MDKLWKSYEIIHKKLAKIRNYLLLPFEFCRTMASWNSVFGSGSIGSGSPRVDGFGRPGSLRVERFGGSEAFGPSPIGPGSEKTERPAGREAIRWIGPRGKALSGGGPSGSGHGKTEGPRAGKPSGGTVWRSGAFGSRADEPGSAETERATGREALGWNGLAERGLRVARQRAGKREDGTVHRIELLSSRPFGGMGIFGSP